MFFNSCRLAYCSCVSKSIPGLPLSTSPLPASLRPLPCPRSQRSPAGLCSITLLRDAGGVRTLGLGSGSPTAKYRFLRRLMRTPFLVVDAGAAAAAAAAAAATYGVQGQAQGSGQQGQVQGRAWAECLNTRCRTTAQLLRL